MKCVFYIFFATCVFFCSVGAMYGDEPAYRGKPASFWVGDLGNKESAQARQEAQEAIRSLGTNVVPYLLDELQALGKTWQNNITNFYQTPTLVKRQTDLLSAFVTLGPIAKPSVPMLAKHIGDNAMAADVIAFALVKIDPPAAAIVLTEALTNRNYFVRASAANNLHGLGPNAAVAVPMLIACIKDVSSDTNGSSNLRVFAAVALGAIGKPAEEAVPTLIHAMQNDESSHVRHAAAKVLAHFDGNAALTVPALTRVVRADEAWQVRAAAALSLSAFGTNAVKSLPDLYSASTNDVERRVRGSADAAIKAIESRKESGHPR